MASHPVVNYSSSSYGGFLFRSPNSPPPSPTPSPPPSIASLSQLFLDARFSCRSRSPIFCSSPACFQVPKPPLLPLPRSATLPAQSKRIPAASSRSRRHSAKRKGKKVLAGTRNQISPPPIEAEEEGKDELQRWPMRAATMEKREMKLIREEEEMMMESSVFSLSPPPSSLPFPRFSLRGPKANSSGGGGGGVSGYCIA